MPAGCTALDFAFQIHTFLGAHCIGAKVNHKLVPLSHKLQSGDQVEILTSKAQRVQPAWINFVSTAKARAKKQAMRRRENREIQKEGEEILKRWLENHDMELTTSILDKLCDLHDLQKHESLLLALGEKTIILGEQDLHEIQGKKKPQGVSGWRKYVPFLGHDKKTNEGKKSKESPITARFFTIGKDFNKKKPIYISEESYNQYVYPHCCHPIPGDDILGFIDNRGHIEIHKRACPVATKLKASFGNRILDAKWEMHKQMFFDATIEIRGIDRRGMLRDVAEIISDQLGVNIHKVTISSDNGIFDGSIELRVHDREDVKVIMESLKKISDLQEISQIM